jgi:basic membrane protein A and related proteins
MRKLFLLVSLLLSFGIAQAQEPLKIAFIFVGPIGDFGWSYMHNQGRLAIDEAFGDEVVTEYVENVDTANAEAVMIELIDAGNTVIVATSYDHHAAVATLAPQYPDIQFVQITGSNPPDNVAVIDGRMYQARYLSGIVAGSMTETNLIGYVAAFPIPEVIYGINAFALGAQSVNPDVVVQVIYTNTWFDPSLESGAADSFLLLGADIIAQDQDSPAAQEAAARVGVMSISYNSDMSSVGETVLTGPVWNWGAKYVDMVQQILDGTYDRTEDYWGGMADGIVDLAPFSPLVPEEVIELVQERREMIESGEWDIFCGPLYGENDGEEVTIVEEGFCLTDAEIRAQLYYVTSVTGDAAPEAAPEGLGEEVK